MTHPAIIEAEEAVSRTQAEATRTREALDESVLSALESLTNQSQVYYDLIMGHVKIHGLMLEEFATLRARIKALEAQASGPQP